MFYFYNENHCETAVFADDLEKRQKMDDGSAKTFSEGEFLKQRGLDFKLEFKALKVLKWMIDHFAGIPTLTGEGEETDNCIYLLTDSPQNRRAYLNMVRDAFGAETEAALKPFIVDLN